MLLKRFRTFCLVFIAAIMLLSLVGCSGSKRLKKDQYQIYHNNNSFIIQVTDTDINAEDIERVKVRIKYKYAVVDHGDSMYDTDFRTKTKTETFEVEKFENTVGGFKGSFVTKDPVTEFDCKKVVAYYTENNDPNDAEIGVLGAIGYSIGCIILGIILWFILAARLVEIETANFISAIPGLICCIAMLITGQWIQALIFFLGIGALVTLLQTICQKFLD